MKSSDSSVSRIGVHKCAEIFENIGFVFREQPIEDYGIDAIIELRGEDYLTGKLIGIQIKSGDSYFEKKNGDNILFYGDIKHYDYWLNHSLPVIIVLYSPSLDKCVWQIITKENAQKCNSGWKIEIPINQLIEKSQKRLISIANKQNDYERRLNSLVVAKNLMIKVLNCEKVILEVQEWINKSSGRGHFKITAIDKKQEKVLYDMEMFGFGNRKYEYVIRDLFPWADIRIDDDYYNLNIEEECFNRSKLSDRDLAKMYGITGEKLLTYSDELPKLYPYRNGAGEVDFYRLVLSLNSLGKSFLELENFLETGNCYFIDKMKL